MARKSPEEILDCIHNEEPFDAELDDGSFTIAVREYLPAVCTALHNGHSLRDELEEKIALSPFERWQEEDPYTGTFIEEMPVRLIANDSRYEYDLNRNREECLYDHAFEREVWQRPLSEPERRESMAKYEQFYMVLDALIEKLEERFGRCVLYDVHAYNFRRKKGPEDLPRFAVGTVLIDNGRYGACIGKWLELLEKMDLGGERNRVEHNGIFPGRTWLIEHVNRRFADTLVVFTEIKKEYCDERTGQVFRDRLDMLKKGFARAIPEHRDFFIAGKY